MEATSLSFPVLLPHPFSVKSRHRKIGVVDHKRLSTKVYAARRDAYNQDHGGRIVDENMIVLRMRIQEMKAVEKNREPPSDWMDWEKRYYPHYDSDICEAIGFLQTQLMNTRPGLALGMVALLTLSIFTSTAMLTFHLMDIAKAMLSLIHLS